MSNFCTKSNSEGDCQEEGIPDISRAARYSLLTADSGANLWLPENSLMSLPRAEKFALYAFVFKKTDRSSRAVSAIIPSFFSSADDFCSVRSALGIPYGSRNWLGWKRLLDFRLIQAARRFRFRLFAPSSFSRTRRPRRCTFRATTAKATVWANPSEPFARTRSRPRCSRLLMADSTAGC